MRTKVILFYVATLAALITLAGCGLKAGTGSRDGDLSKWTIAGVGDVKPSPEGIGWRVTEGKNSKGLTLVSPRPYKGDAAVRFKVKPEKYEGVCVVLLSTSDQKTGGLKVPADHDGAMTFWTEGTVRNYMVAFHTGFHQPNMYIRRNPGMTEIVQKKDAAPEQRWYDIEISVRRNRLMMKVDGTPVLDAVDSAGALPGGYVGIRLRGPGDGTYSCLFKDVSVKKK